jgi:hypothetical protein
MTEYDHSPEAYEWYMATQTRILNWANNVSQSVQMGLARPSPNTPEHHQPHSRRIPDTLTVELSFPSPLPRASSLP